MKKSIKILFVAIIFIILFTFNICNAVPIDMNLEANNSTENMYNFTNDTTYENTSYNLNSTNSTNSTVTTPTNNAGNTGSSVSSLASLPESELGLTNILNILLIAVGFILILLAIAILIRLSKK